METNSALLPAMDEKRDGEIECKESADISMEGRHLSNGVAKEDCKVGPMKDIGRGLKIRGVLSGATGELRERCREDRRETLGESMGNMREAGERTMCKTTRRKLGRMLDVDRQRTGEETVEEEDRGRGNVTDGDMEGKCTTDARMEGDREGDAGMEGDREGDAGMEGHREGDAGMEGDREGDAGMEGHREGDAGMEGEREGDAGMEGHREGDAGMEGEREGDSGTEGGREGGGVAVIEGEEDERRNPWKPTPHPILSRMLIHSSSASSTSSSFNASSAESDDVFSEEEEVPGRRKTMRKCRSWRTFLTMMHWSVRRQSSWVQLAGHQGNFRLGEGGEVLKLFSEVEATCLEALMTDPLRLFVPQYHGVITRGGLSYLRLEDLLSGLKNPVIMDCKMGVRTYQVEELHKARTKPTLRTDMYQKIVKVDPTALSPEEHEQQGVTKWHYLQWRDTTSSSSTLGFRIEGIMMENGRIQRDFRRMMSFAEVTEALLSFTKSQQDILRAYYSRLQALGEALKESPFFKTHEVIGSSLLFVHDNSGKASIWMIDFGKTTPVPSGLHLTHNVPWAEGNREDGYLIGLASLTSSLGQAINGACLEEVDDSRGGTDTHVHLQEHAEEQGHRDEHLHIQEHNPN